MIIATLHTPFVIALDFAFDAATNATLKRIGAEFNKAGKFWALPISRLDKLIDAMGDSLTCDAEVWLAASPKSPAMVRAENDAWMQTLNMPIQRQEGANLADCRATVAVGSLTPFDKLLIDGLPRWAANEEREAARKGKGQRWTR